MKNSERVVWVMAVITTIWGFYALIIRPYWDLELRQVKLEIHHKDLRSDVDIIRRKVCRWETSDEHCREWFGEYE